MRRQCVLGIGLVGLALLVVGSAAANAARRHASVHVTYVQRQSVVQAGSTASYTAQCPPSDPHPVGGEFNYLSAGAPGQLALAASYPLGQRGWVVVVANVSAQPQGYFAGIVCVRAKATFAYPRTTVVAQPQHADGPGAVCPSSAPHSINSYFGPQSPADLGKELEADNGGGPGGKHQGAFVDLENLSAAPVGLFGGAVCTSLRTAARDTPYETLAPGSSDPWTMTCPSATPFPVSGRLATKASSDYGTLVLTFSSEGANARQWQVGAKSLTNRPVSYFAGAVCIGDSPR